MKRSDNGFSLALLDWGVSVHMPGHCKEAYIRFRLDDL